MVRTATVIRYFLIALGLLIGCSQYAYAKPPTNPMYHFVNPFYVDMELLDWSTMEYLRKYHLYRVKAIHTTDFGDTSSTEYYFNKNHKLDSLLGFDGYGSRKRLHERIAYQYDREFRLVSRSIEISDGYWEKKSKLNDQIDRKLTTRFSYTEVGEIEGQSIEIWMRDRKNKLVSSGKDSLRLVGHQDGYALYRSPEAADWFGANIKTYYLRDGYLVKSGTPSNYDSLDIQDTELGHFIEYFTVANGEAKHQQKSYFDQHWQLQRKVIDWSSYHQRYMVAMVDNFINHEGQLELEYRRTNRMVPPTKKVYERSWGRLDRCIKTEDWNTYDEKTGKAITERRKEVTTYTYPEEEKE